MGKYNTTCRHCGFLREEHDGTGLICPNGQSMYSGALKTKIICYCGSLRFLEVFKRAEHESMMEGVIALLPCCMFTDIQRTYGEMSKYKLAADELHKRKIDICDEVFVLNVGGYIGNSTRSEIDYALKIGKPVKYLES